MLTKLMKKAISSFEIQFKGKGVEIRNVYLIEGADKQAHFNIECNLLALNKYYKVSVLVTNNQVTYFSDLIEL